MNREPKRQKRRQVQSWQLRREHTPEWDLLEMPMDLIRKMARMKLTPSEFVVLAYLLSVDGGWKRNRPVAEPLCNIWEATGLSYGTIHKAKRGLIAKGFMVIVNVRNKERTNTYDLSPMRQKLIESRVNRGISVLPKRVIK